MAHVGSAALPALLLLALAHAGTDCVAFMLTPDAKCPGGIAHGNGTRFDISSLMAWPQVMTVPCGNGCPQKTYTYWFSPCGSIPEPKCQKAYPHATAMTVCQRADMHYNCGGSNSVQFSWNTVYGPAAAHQNPAEGRMSSSSGQNSTSFMKSDDFLFELDISYGAPYMYSWRGSRVKVIGGPTGTATTIEMVGENPELSYNFVIKTEARKVFNVQG